jgi:hypothetical protein
VIQLKKITMKIKEMARVCLAIFCSPLLVQKYFVAFVHRKLGVALEEGFLLRINRPGTQETPKQGFESAIEVKLTFC